MTLLLTLFVALAFGEAEPSQYVWHENGNEMKIWVDPTKMAKLEYPSNAPKSASPRVTLFDTDEATKAGLEKGRMPKRVSGKTLVFRDAPDGGRRMVATGNVLVRFQEGFRESAVQGWAKARKTVVVEKVSTEPNTFIIASAPGTIAIGLANDWRADGNVVGIEPIWWKELSPR